MCYNDNEKRSVNSETFFGGVWRRKEGRQGRARKFRLGYFFAKVTHIKLGAKMAERGDREAQRTCRHIFGDENLCGAYKEKARFGLAKFAIASPKKSEWRETDTAAQCRPNQF